MSETKTVLEHHLEVFAAGDVEATISDYADDATVITHDDVYQGTAEIKELFESLYDEFETTVEFNLERQVIDDDCAYIVWNAETGENIYQHATDTFVIENGNIVTQTLAAKINPK
jgi:ketosteroid isomerase-like protein